MATESRATVDLGTRSENYYLHALVGAVVTVVTSFVPFSPLLGGAVAGYLQDRPTGHGARVGAVSGAIAALPLAAIFGIVLVVMTFGSLSTGEFAGPLFVVVLVGTVLLAAAVYTVGLSAVGGYVGAAFAESRRAKRLREAEAESVPEAEPTADAESTADAEQSN